jgi:hypothetical protein
MNESPGIWRRVWWALSYLTWAEWGLIVIAAGLAIWILRR